MRDGGPGGGRTPPGPSRRGARRHGGNAVGLNPASVTSTTRRPTPGDSGGGTNCRQRDDSGDPVRRGRPTCPGSWWAARNADVTPGKRHDTACGYGRPAAHNPPRPSEGPGRRAVNLPGPATGSGGAGARLCWKVTSVWRVGRAGGRPRRLASTRSSADDAGWRGDARCQVPAGGCDLDDVRSPVRALASGLRRDTTEAVRVRTSRPARSPPRSSAAVLLAACPSDDKFLRPNC